MLDVAIGLVLTIALLSLVATAGREAYAGMRNSRGRNLVRLVCSLVGDNKGLSQEIMSHPFIQTMAMERPRANGARDPSYLPSDVFVTALLDFLTRYTGHVRPASPAVLVHEVRLRMDQDKDHKFATSLAALLPGAENDWPVFEKRLQAWFDAVGERSSGWYKRENQMSLFLIGFLLALAINVNPIVISRALWNDAALRESSVERAQLALDAYQAGDGTGLASAAGSGAAAAPAPASLPADPAAGKLRLASDEALDTVDKLLNRSAEELTDRQLIAGANPAVAERAVLALRGALARERAAGSGGAAQAGGRAADVDTVDSSIGTLRGQVPKGAADAKNCGTDGYLSCPVLKDLDTALTALEAGVAAERRNLAARPVAGDAQAAVAILTSQCAQIEDASSTRALCDRLGELGVFVPARMPIGWSDATWPAVFNCDAAVDRAAGACPSWRLASWADAGNWIVALAGWLMTGLGVTLGAPFWFDLLGKLMKVRSSGVKPVEGSEALQTGAVAGGTAAPSTLTPSGQGAADGGRPGPDDALNDAERALSEEEITRVQRSLGMEATAQTGRLDMATRSAIAVWQTRYGASATGELTQVQIAQLLINPTMLEDDGYVG
jgi:hypothetical protein